jgi:hypothetical protein
VSQIGPLPPFDYKLFRVSTNVTKACYAALMLCLIASRAVADGLTIKDGRYVGPVVVFDLTASQKNAVEHFRTCHVDHFQTMNTYTPYVFRLTPKQSATLRRRVGFSPTAFQILETYRGENDAGPFWNVVLRFSESQIEIPVDLILPNKEAVAAHRTQGWSPINPCFPRLKLY